MGASTVETVREIEEVRDRLDEEVRELEQRLPAVARTAKKAARLAAGGGLAGSVALFALKRARSKKRSKKKDKDAGFAVPRGATVVQVMPVRVPDELASAVKDGRWRPYAAAATGVWLGVQVARLAVAFRSAR
jgi:hypothetical protein